MTEDEKAVKAKWPDAYWSGVQGSFRIWSTWRTRRKIPGVCLGTGPTIDTAWADAATREQAALADLKRGLRVAE